jgi:hypothetical protein
MVQNGQKNAKWLNMNQINQNYAQGSVMAQNGLRRTKMILNSPK